MSLFGPGGIGGEVNRDVTPEVALRLGMALGRRFPGTVAVATDTRASAREVEAAVASGIMSAGADVLDLGVLPSPALQFHMASHDVSAGVMVSSPRGDRSYSGLRVFLKGGDEATAADEAELEEEYRREASQGDAASVGVVRHDAGSAEDYVRSVVSSVDAGKIRDAGLTVCADCGGSAAGLTTPLILRELGVKALVIGDNPAAGDGWEDDLRCLRAAVEPASADLGVAHDGDGSRALFVDGRGCIVPADMAGAVVAKAMLRGRKGRVVAPVGVTKALEDVVESSGGTLKRVSRGSRETARKAVELEAVLGVDDRGGMVFPEVRGCRDGGLALAKMLEVVAESGPLADLVAELPAYSKVEVSVECPEGVKAPLLGMFFGEARDSGLSTDTTDGLKVSSDDGWILLRPSRSGQVFRITSESTDEGKARRRADEAAERAREFVSKNAVNRASWRGPPRPRLSASPPGPRSCPTGPPEGTPR